MIVYIFLMVVIVLLIIHIIYLQKLHFDEIKVLYNKIGIETKFSINNSEPSRLKNHIKRKIIEMERQGSE